MNKIPVRNSDTGAVGAVTEEQFNNPAFNKDGILVRVKAGAKPANPAMWKSKVKDANKEDTITDKEKDKA